jgi:hypothetical protein
LRYSCCYVTDVQLCAAYWRMFLCLPKEMENISRGPPSGILSPSALRRRCRTSQLQYYRVQEYRLPSPPSFKSNVLRESLSVDSQNIPCATLKRRGSWVISSLYTPQASPTAQLFIFPPAHPEKRLARYQEGRLVPPFLDNPRVRLYFIVYCYW